MSWVTITIADLKDAKAAALIDACRTAALGDGQSDPTPAIIADVTARIRAEAAACRANVLDADTTRIPAELKSLACRMIIRQCQSRLQLALTEDEREEQRNDLRYLERIAKCEVPISATDDPIYEEVQAGAVSPRMAAKSRFFRRGDEDGI